MCTFGPHGTLWDAWTLWDPMGPYGTLGPIFFSKLFSKNKHCENQFPKMSVNHSKNILLAPQKQFLSSGGRFLEPRYKPHPRSQDKHIPARVFPHFDITPPLKGIEVRGNHGEFY